MNRNPEGQMICKHCNEPITLKDPGETWVNADPDAYHRKCYDKAIIKPAERAATLRAVYEKAYFASLGGFCAAGNAENEYTVVTFSREAALETVRQWPAMQAELDALIGEMST